MVKSTPVHFLQNVVAGLRAGAKDWYARLTSHHRSPARREFADLEDFP
jgi:hypothetical protein